MLAQGALVALVLINEVRYDPPGVDAGGEYVELLNATSSPVELDASWSLERGNGGRPSDWTTVWFGDGTRLDPGDRLVLGDDPRSSRDVVLGLQNGPDACRLVHASAVIDLVGWGAHTYPEYVEGVGAPDPASGHIGRWPDGTDTNVNAGDFREAEIETPGVSNSPERWLSLGPAWPPTAPPHLPSGSAGGLRLEVANAGTVASPAGRSSAISRPRRPDRSACRSPVCRRGPRRSAYCHGMPIASLAARRWRCLCSSAMTKLW
jgi:hypothetical protein